jgi:microcin C transport system permease protein
MNAPMSPGQRAWARFRRNRLGWVSCWILGAMLLVSLASELVSNDRPLIAVMAGAVDLPGDRQPPERRYGGDFDTPTDWKDPFIVGQFARADSWRLFTP